MEFGDYIQSMGIILLFFVVLYGAYYASKILGKSQMKGPGGKNMQIVEVLAVGQQKTLQLVKVGTKYLLIAVSKDQVTFIQEVDESDLSLESSNENIVPFSNFFNKLIHKEHTTKENERLGEEFDENQKK